MIVPNTVPRETWYNPRLCSTSIEVGKSPRAFQFHKRGGHNIHFIVLLIALLIVASFVVSLRAPAGIGVGLSSDFVRRGLTKFL